MNNGKAHSDKGKYDKRPTDIQHMGRVPLGHAAPPPEPKKWWKQRETENRNRKNTNKVP